MRFFFKMLLAVFFAIVGTWGPLQAQTLTVGCDQNLKPFVYADAQGHYTGFDIAVWREITKAMGVEFELRPMAFAELLPALEEGRLDAALGALSITAAQEKRIDFSYPYYDAGLIVMVKKDNPFIQGIGDLDDKIVATKRGTTSDDFAHNIQTKAVKLFATIEEAYAALQAGQADAVIFDSTVILHFIKTEGQDTFKTVGRLYNRQAYGFAFPSGSPWRDKASIAVLELRDGFNYAIIYSEWFGPYNH